MADRYIFADLTSHRRGFGVQSAINAAARRSQTGDVASKLVWIIPSHLAPEFAGIPATVCDGPASEVWSEIQRQVELIKAKSSEFDILVVTWDQSIYDWAQSCGLGLHRIKWFNLLSEDRFQ